MTILECSLRTIKKHTDQILRFAKIPAPNGNWTEIESNRPANRLFMSNMQRFRDTLLGDHFGVVRISVQPQYPCEDSSGCYPVVNLICIQSNPRDRRAVEPQRLFQVLACKGLLPKVT